MTPEQRSRKAFDALIDAVIALKRERDYAATMMHVCIAIVHLQHLVLPRDLDRVIDDMQKFRDRKFGASDDSTRSVRTADDGHHSDVDESSADDVVEE